MQALLIRPSVFVVLLGLAACGGSGGGGDSGGTGPDAIPNGLAYGAVGQSLDDTEVVVITAQKASFQAGQGAVPAIDRGTITLDAGFIAALQDATRDGTLEIFGQTVTITNGVGYLTDGEEVRITYDPTRSGTYAGALDINVSSVGDINGEGAYVFGFETDPVEVAALSGSLVYTGEFVALGSLGASQTTSTEFEGGMTVEVDFAGVGSADVTMNGRLNNANDATLGGNLALGENGFAGDLTCSTGCNNGGASSVDARFYGPDAAELGGVVAVDITVGGQSYDGVGTFILIDPTLP